MEILNNIINSINGVLWGYILIVLLIALGLFFTLRSGFAQARLFKDMIGLITTKLPSLAVGEQNVKGQISSFQAFCISVASHVGTGNLAGVAIAVAIGGPGALFWMWIIALLGMATSLVENTLAQVYKVRDELEPGAFRGGPAYYMEKALGQKWLGSIFSIIIIITFGLIFNTVQANTIAQSFEGAFGLSVNIGGIIIAIFTAIVIFGGIKRIADVSSILVPVMAVAYVIIAVIVLCINFREIPALFSSIVENAIGVKQAVGGGLGVVILQGVKRGLYSNEAGMGSAPNAAATSHVSHPVKQGLMQAFGVFVDTILICTATGFIVLLYPGYQSGAQGIKLTQLALSHSVGSWGAMFITVCIFLFAFSSIIGNYYYGESNIDFLLNSKFWLTIFRILVVIIVYVGSIMDLNLVWNMADTFMGTMALINIVTITILSPIAIKVIKDYIKQRKEGKNPVFKASSIPGLKNAECWGDNEN